MRRMKTMKRNKKIENENENENEWLRTKADNKKIHIQLFVNYYSGASFNYLLHITYCSHLIVIRYSSTFLQMSVCLYFMNTIFHFPLLFLVETFLEMSASINGKPSSIV